MDIRIRDKKVPLPKALIKLGKAEYMNNYIKNGELRFSPAKIFAQMEEGNDKIADKNEGSLYYRVSHLVAAPIIGESESGMPMYGRMFKIADKANIRLTNEKIQKIPFHCLYCYDYLPINTIVKLHNYDQIVSDFPDYDMAVIICNVPEFLKRIKSNFAIYFNHVMYTDITPSKSEIENPIHYLFYKRRIFEQQKEFRIALPKLKIEGPQNYTIGSLEDIAYCIPLSFLKYGIIIAENDSVFEEIKANFEQNSLFQGHYTGK